MLEISKNLHVYDNFFINPDKVIDLGQQLSYNNHTSYPGKRSDNLFTIQDPNVHEFAKFFTKKIADTVLYGLEKFEIDIRFHYNDVYNNTEANYGWIHNDSVEYAGLVYLSNIPTSMNHGTSIYDKLDPNDFSTDDFDSRKQFNISKEVTDQYLQDLKNNHNQFKETINVGYKYNRLVAYDAMMWHRPNNYLIENSNRFSLLFFINNTKIKKQDSLLKLTSEWKDL